MADSAAMTYMAVQCIIYVCSLLYRFSRRVAVCMSVSCHVTSRGGRNWLCTMISVMAVTRNRVAAYAVSVSAVSRLTAPVCHCGASISALRRGGVVSRQRSVSSFASSIPSYRRMIQVQSLSRQRLSKLPLTAGFAAALADRPASVRALTRVRIRLTDTEPASIDGRYDWHSLTRRRLKLTGSGH